MYIAKAQLYQQTIPKSSANTSASVATPTKPEKPAESAKKYHPYSYPTTSRQQTTLPYEEIALRKASKQTGLTYHHVKQMWTNHMTPHNATEDYAMHIVQQIIYNYNKKQFTHYKTN